MNFKRLVIIGGTGFVGRNLAKHLRPHFETIIPLSHGQCWHSEPNDLVINAAGMKDVPACDKNPTYAYESNAILAGRIAQQCRDFGCKLIHISSDHAYAEPRTVYGDSKRLGEELVRRECPDAIIAVTGHVYDVDCIWVKWLDGELRAGRKVEAWADIDNAPTYAGDLANAILLAVKDNIVGTVRLVGHVSLNRFDLFCAYARCFRFDANFIIPVIGCAPSHYPRSFNIGKRSMDLVSPVEGFRRMRDELEQERMDRADDLSNRNE